MNDLSQMILKEFMSASYPRNISRDDAMFGGHKQHYFGVGHSAMLCIMQAMIARLAYQGGETLPETILDFGAGHGRVARHLRAAFPRARVEVTDFDSAGAAYCVDELGCHPMGEAVPENHYDLIWVGSVITHLPEAASLELITRLKRGLRPLGVLMITTGGRLGLAHQAGFATGRTDHPYDSYGMSAEGAAVIVRDFESNGHGYHDYPGQSGYGGALISPGWMYRHAVDETTIQLMFQEMAWDTHQDVHGFMRLAEGGLLKTQRGPYMEPWRPG